MSTAPSPEVVARIMAFEGDHRPGVARLAMEALAALAGVEPPLRRPVRPVRRPYKPGIGGVER